MQVKLNKMWSPYKPVHVEYPCRQTLYTSLRGPIPGSEELIKYLVPIQMHDIHLKANQGLHQGDGDISVQVVSSAFKHRMSKSRRIPPNHQYHLKCVTELKLKKKTKKKISGQKFLLQHFNTEA